MSSSTKFDQLYNKLNLAQREAVDAIEGPVMVIAGPGTGKTSVLTLRIANILKQTDTSPDSILALTFTESAAHNLRSRLVSIVGATGYRVNIFTFHSFCNDVIRRYAPHFPGIVGYAHGNIIDQILILEDIIKHSRLTKLKPFGNPFIYVRDIISVIGKLKRENIDANKLEKLIKLEPKERHERNLEFLQIYRGYQRELRKKGYYDYDDMIMEVISTLKSDKELLRSLQEEYQYVLADEHQDANAAQNELLELLMSFHKSPNIFVVGDEKQAIFRFQGASLENFTGFKKTFPDAKLIALTHNYRSRPDIVSAASKLMNDGKLVSAKKVKTPGIPGIPGVWVAELENHDQEMQFLKSDIESRITKGQDPGEIAVIYRDNKDALTIVRALEKSSIQFIVESDLDILDDQDMRKLIAILRAVDKPFDHILLASALHADFLRAESLDIYQMIWDKKVPSNLQPLVSKFQTWHKMSKNKSLIEIFEILVRESGFLSHLISLSDAVEKLEKLNTLFDELKTLIENHKTYSLTDFLNYIDLLSAHHVLIKTNSKRGEGVRLMTAHRSKGQEFDVVYIVGAVEGHWGGRRVRDPLAFVFMGADSDTEDERRVFYVALTRAREEVIITYAKIKSDGRHNLPTRFIEEIKPELITPKFKIGKKIEKSAVFDAKVNFGIPISNKEYLNKLFSEQGLSVSALNNFLSCPWKYFYVNLLRVPTALEPHHMYGIAIHAAMKDLFDQNLTKPKFLTSFKQYLSTQPLSEPDFIRALQKGEKSLSGWFDQYYKSSNKNVITELAIKGIELDGVKLTGRLDKLELLDTHGSVSVVDYKTGKPKSRNQIIKDGYQRQLIFYKILLDHFANQKYKMISSEIDFIEPNERGYYKKEKFEISESEVKELIQTIKEVSNQVLNLTFWTETCEDKKCPWCALRRMISPL